MGARVTFWAASCRTGDLAVTTYPSLAGGTEPLSSCMVPASMTRGSTCGETVGWARGECGSRSHLFLLGIGIAKLLRGVFLL